MAILENTLWRGEPVKAVIKFDSNTEYTVYTDLSLGNTENFIKQINFDLNEGNNRVNPLGISTSNNINMQVYDTSDNLSPANTESIYYGKVVNGVEIDLFITYDGVTWEPYGVYYTTSWDGNFSEGGHGLVNIGAEDKLNTIGNYDLPDLPAYSNVEAGDLIANVMNGLGIGPDKYTIDPSINKSLMYGIVAGSKVRDFFNNICQLLFARVIIDRTGIIRFVPALGVYNTGNELNIGTEFTGSFTNRNNNNINYNKISVRYLEAGDKSRGTIFNDNSHSLTKGNNIITDIAFKNRALSIEQVHILYNETEEGALISSFNYRGYQNGIQLNIKVDNGDIPDCKIVGEGVIISTTDKCAKVDIDNATIIGGSTFEFDTKQMMTYSEAQTLANSLKNYLSTISRNVIMSGTALTPKLYIGDKIVISGSNTMYDGEYKIIALNIIMGEDYSLTATLIRLN